MKRKFVWKSLTAITWLLVFSVMGTWLVSMACLTVVTAQKIYDVLYEDSLEFVDEVNGYGRIWEFYDPNSYRYGMQYDRPDFPEYDMFRAISANVTVSYDYRIHYPMETAILFYDVDGNLLHSSEEDILYFDYFTQEEWDAGIDIESGLHFGWIDISEGKGVQNREKDPYLYFRDIYAGVHHLHNVSAIRVTGFFEGNELKPVVMHYVTDTLVHQAVVSTDQFSVGENSDSYIISDVDRTGRLEWQLQFDRSAEYDVGNLVTVYLEHPDMWEQKGAPMTYGGENYENLAVLAQAMDLPLKDSQELNNKSIFKLHDLLVFGRWDCDDFYLVTAIRSNPLACAVNALRSIYIATGLIAFMLLLLVRRSIKKHLVQPVADIAVAMEEGQGSIYRPNPVPSMWTEVSKLNAGFAVEQDRFRMKENEITRLQTALEYAKTAEQNRRRITSDIAHELKTPLAVIHSYAEGLKEHIAEEKRDKYIAVILSEAEHADSMVLDMLDLSRLEAGRVRLSRDDFSLVALTRSVFEKLEMAMQAKNLQVDFLFPEDFTIIADESRIAQVIENFATNAIKYTPVGGRIVVKIETMRTKTLFSMENECTPLSNEALHKVWDAFYRVDESSSDGGTGLGLAIAKSIVELHGGECYVHNTKSGIEFGFKI